MSIPQQYFWGFSRTDPISPGAVIVTESGNIDELRRSSSGGQCTYDIYNVDSSLQSNKGSQLVVAQPSNSAQRLVKGREIRSTNVKADLEIISARDMTIPTSWDLCRREAGNFHDRIPKLHFGRIPRLEQYPKDDLQHQGELFDCIAMLAV